MTLLNSLGASVSACKTQLLLVSRAHHALWMGCYFLLQRLYLLPVGSCHLLNYILLISENDAGASLG